MRGLQQWQRLELNGQHCLDDWRLLKIGQMLWARVHVLALKTNLTVDVWLSTADCIAAEPPLSINRSVAMVRCMHRVSSSRIPDSACSTALEDGFRFMGVVSVVGPHCRISTVPARAGNGYRLQGVSRVQVLDTPNRSSTRAQVLDTCKPYPAPAPWMCYFIH